MLLALTAQSRQTLQPLEIDPEKTNFNQINSCTSGARPCVGFLDGSSTGAEADMQVSATILQVPSVFCTSQLGESRADVEGIIASVLFKLLMVVEIFAIPLSMQDYFGFNILVGRGVSCASTWPFLPSYLLLHKSEN